MHDNRFLTANERQQQLIMPLSVPDEAQFDNFIVSPEHESLLAFLRTFVSGQSERVVYLYGASGSGCSHLLQALCYEAHQQGKRSVYLPLQKLPQIDVDLFVGLERCDLICIDDVSLIAQSPAWEEALFYCYNRVMEQGGKMAFASQCAPKALHLTLPDLHSRLLWGTVYAVAVLPDELKLHVLMQRAARRGIDLSADVADFLLNHCPRHLGELIRILDILDRASLSEHRRLTIPYVKVVLQI